MCTPLFIIHVHTHKPMEICDLESGNSVCVCVRVSEAQKTLCQLLVSVVFTRLLPMLTYTRLAVTLHTTYMQNPGAMQGAMQARLGRECVFLSMGL